MESSSNFRLSRPASPNLSRRVPAIALCGRLLNRAQVTCLRDYRAIHKQAGTQVLSVRVGENFQPWMGGARLRLWEEKPRLPSCL
jgi:hypothetical protein